MTKDDIRKEKLKKRDFLTDTEILEKSRSIRKKVTALSEYREAENILVYASSRSEVVTDVLIEESLKAGKNVFCPKVTDKKKAEMKFIKIESLSDLKEGYAGIREPGDEIGSMYFTDDLLDKSLMLMPGVAFDKEHNRIGYKGGYYDRFLENRKNMKKAALSFECQISGEIIPVEETDVKADMVVTEKGILY